MVHPSAVKTATVPDTLVATGMTACVAPAAAQFHIAMISASQDSNRGILVSIPTSTDEHA